MKTKQLILAIIVTAIVGNAHAQTQAPISFGVSAGVNFQNLTGKDVTGEKYNDKLKTGFNVGANVEILVAPDFYLQPGVLFATKGSKYKNVDGSTNLSYIEIPVNFMYKPQLGNGKLLLGVGPYAGFAVGGKYKSSSGNSDVHFGSGIEDIKRFDAGGNLLVGYELSNHLSAQLNAGLGLVNINNRPDGDNKSSLKNTGFGISFGYRFN